MKILQILSDLIPVHYATIETHHKKTTNQNNTLRYMEKQLFAMYNHLSPKGF